MLRIQYDQDIDSQKNLGIREETRIFDFLSHININLNELLNDSNHIVDQKKIEKIKEYIFKITDLINAILNEREVPISESEVRRFKKLILNYLEKTVLKNTFKS